ncbi:hypothetical protein [uncultured Tateyamaria sp.]|uniref:hypothetical protein n=1 Tax=uncultured Tateyamaria sp. TaxID=455651 RepID=UPI00260FDF22|nr:hypothetical protein [uncultured Tateyamaria sp.]
MQILPPHDTFTDAEAESLSRLIGFENAGSWPKIWSHTAFRDRLWSLIAQSCRCSCPIESVEYRVFSPLFPMGKDTFGQFLDLATAFLFSKSLLQTTDGQFLREMAGRSGQPDFLKMIFDPNLGVPRFSEFGDLTTPEQFVHTRAALTAALLAVVCTERRPFLQLKLAAEELKDVSEVTMTKNLQKKLVILVAITLKWLR